MAEDTESLSSGVLQNVLDVVLLCYSLKLWGLGMRTYSHQVLLELFLRGPSSVRIARTVAIWAALNDTPSWLPDTDHQLVWVEAHHRQLLVCRGAL